MEAQPCSDCKALTDRLDALERVVNEQNRWKSWQAGNSALGGSFGFAAIHGSEDVTMNGEL